MTGEGLKYSNSPRRSLEERGWRERRAPRPEQLRIVLDPLGRPTKTKIYDALTGEHLPVTKLELQLEGNQMMVASIERIAIVNDWNPSELFTYWDRDIPVRLELGDE